MRSTASSGGRRRSHIRRSPGGSAKTICAWSRPLSWRKNFSASSRPRSSNPSTRSSTESAGQDSNSSVAVKFVSAMTRFASTLRPKPVKSGGNRLESLKLLFRSILRFQLYGCMLDAESDLERFLDIVEHPMKFVLAFDHGMRAQGKAPRRDRPHVQIVDLNDSPDTLHCRLNFVE